MLFNGTLHAGGVRFGTYFATVIPIYIWSDGFEPNNSRKDVKNVWMMIVSIAPPPDMMFHPDYVYVYAVQQTRGHHVGKFDPTLAYTTFANDVQQMGTQFMQVRALNNTFIPIRPMPGVIPVDSPERTSILWLSLSHSSTYHKIFLHNCNFSVQVCNTMLDALIDLYKQLLYERVWDQEEYMTKMQYLVFDLEWYQKKHPQTWQQAIFEFVEFTYTRDLMDYFPKNTNKEIYLALEVPTLLKLLLQHKFDIDHHLVERWITPITGAFLLSTVTTLLKTASSEKATMTAKDQFTMAKLGLSTLGKENILRMFTEIAQQPGVLLENGYLRERLPIFWVDSVLFPCKIVVQPM